MIMSPNIEFIGAVIRTIQPIPAVGSFCHPISTKSIFVGEAVQT